LPPVAALALVGAAVWYAAQPPTADALYQRIEQAAGQDNSAALAASENDVQRFLKRYGDDPRAARVTTWQEQIALTRFERKLELRARQSTDSSRLSPVEQMFLDALRAERTGPEEAARRFAALVDLFGGQEDAPKATRRCVELAQRRAAQLAAQIDATCRQHLELLEQRIAHADAIRACDPNAAAAIYRGIVALYSDKPWADALVEQAAEALQRLSADE